jgi:uncharacterized membrane protein YedE/YeeE
VTFLPFWIVAPALAALAVGYWIALRRPLGVSGVLARFSRIREEAEFDRGAAVLQAEQAALEAAMSQLTAEAFGAELTSTGTDGTALAGAPAHTEWPAPAPEAPAVPEGRVCAPTPRLAVHATFLVSIAVGGLLASLVRGGFGAGMGTAFAAQFGTGAGSIAALAGGGVLVGFGTALCGGCSSGHGLTGCGRLMPGSLLATVVFFSSAVAASILLGRLA